MISGEPQAPGRIGHDSPSTLDWLNGDVTALRPEYERQRTKPMPANSQWLTVERAHGSIRVLVHRVSTPSEIAIVYFHGGGFIVGSPLTHADITSELCRSTGLPLYSVDYRLAPDHVAPAPVEDGMAVIRHLLLANGVQDIVLVGDSAGGAVALAVEAGLPQILRNHIIGVVSFYGAFGLFDTLSLLQSGSRADGTDVGCVRRYFALANGDVTESPYTISSLARPSPVPVLLVAANEDPLRDDTLALARSLQSVGRDISVIVADHQPHGFLHDVAHSQYAADCIDQVTTWILARGRRSNKATLV